MLFFVLILTCSVKLIFVGCFSVDQTLISGAKGEDVVDACIQKINNAPEVSKVLNNDFGFFKRIALVESDFGKRENLLINKGGIWQISQSIEERLLSADNTSSLITAFFNDFGSYLDFRNSDFSIPLRSAVAARIFLEIQLRSNENFPGTVSEQGSWWVARYYSNGQSQTFISTVNSFEEMNTCTVSTLDLWFLVDGSGSIGAYNFQSCLKFVNQTAATFTISPDRVRTGLMIYSSTTVTRSLLNEHQSNEEFSNIVLSTPYPGGGTATGAAISKVASAGFNERNGARSTSQGVPRILVALTDGQSGDSVVQPSIDIKNMGVIVFGVGVGSGFAVSEINEIASDPDSTYAFEFTQFEALSAVLRDRVATQACEVPAVVPDNTSVSVLVLSQSTFYSQVQLPSNGSVQLTYEVSVTNGSVTVYLSEFISNPNSAYHDARFALKPGFNTYIYNSIETTEDASTRGKQDATNTTKILYSALELSGEESSKITFTSVPNAERVIFTTHTTNAGTMGNSGVKVKAETGVVSAIIMGLIVVVLSQVLKF